MKKIKKIISLGLTLCFLVTMIACKGNNNGSEHGSDESSVNSEEIVSPTGQWIIENGETDYKIVVSDTAGPNIVMAIEELNYFVSEATGVTFEVVKDDEVSYEQDAKYISIGSTDLVAQANITLSELLGTDGTQIVTRGHSLFLMGGTERAASYAVYDWLADTLNYEYYFTDCYSLDKDVKKIPLKEYNTINVPDIEYRSANYGWILDDPIVMNRTRTRHYFGEMVGSLGGAVHNSLQYIVGQDEGHEAYWYSTDSTQLCYTARGDETEYEALQQACLNTATRVLINEPNATILTLTIQDSNTFCNCSACESVISKYGASSAVVILFMNDLRVRLNAWFESEEGLPYKRDVELLFFAYFKTVDAPATYDAISKKWIPNEGIQCADGVSVYYAPIQADYTKSWEDKSNESVLKTLDAWRAVSKKMYLWTYSTGFQNYMVWYDTFNGMQATYQIARDSGTAYIFDQAQYSKNPSAYAWGNLKAYLNYKLAWDVDIDMETHINKWFDNYFGPVAEEMQAFFNKQRVHMNYLIDNDTGYSCKQSCGSHMERAVYWPKPLLQDWLQELNSIIGKLDYLKKVDMDVYNTYYKRIATERLSVYYLLVQLYENSISSEAVQNYKEQFKKDALAIGFEKTGENKKPISSILQSWGVQ